MAPATVNPAPARVTEFTRSAAVPEEVNVNVLVTVVFTVTLPKASVLALNVSCGVSAAVPVPLSATLLVGPLDELLEMAMVPLAAPVTLGSKLT